MTLEDYLRKNLALGITDHTIRARFTKVGDVIFYIHADSHNSDTLDFRVFDNDLVRIEGIIPE